MQHLHISGFALFLFAVFLCVVLAIFLSFIESIRADKRRDAIEMERVKRGDYGSGSVGAINHTFSAAPAAPIGGQPVYAAAPVVAPGYSGGDVALGMFAGVALGSAMSHHGGGYAPVYVEPVVYDSGPACYGSDGGIDIDFGGD